MTASHLDLESFPAWLVTQPDEGAPRGGLVHLGESDLPKYDTPTVLIETEYSSLNYKDALASQGHRGVAGSLPHVPGIDCAGRVLKSESDDFQTGDPVLITGYDLGSTRWGGYSGVVRAPASWVVPRDERLTAREAMIYGTAGFTAAQCVDAIVERVAPDAGPVLVTGSTGGVGGFAVAILAKLGYRVIAITGKPDRAEGLHKLGATEVLGRDALEDESGRPMLSERWAAAVDTVGGRPLTNVLKATGYRGVVAACGLVAGADLPLSVYPFLLRGVTLAGIDSAKCPRGPRLQIWERLAADWRVDLPEELVQTVTLSDLPGRIEQILAGQIAGRVLVRPAKGAG
ncbi:putative acrylyl-CoA reductase AcuI [Planctomycetes bacterium MalM25]|nr:putative acrylyl-CoA reductase AcuI [Planctomycetes bacterium MalM25]